MDSWNLRPLSVPEATLYYRANDIPIYYACLDVFGQRAIQYGRLAAWEFICGKVDVAIAVTMAS